MTVKEKKNYRATKKWKLFRFSILEKYNFYCQLCNQKLKGKKSRRLHIHHIDPDTYGNENVEDVVLLCAACHQELERLISKKIKGFSIFDIKKYCEKLLEIVGKS